MQRSFRDTDSATPSTSTLSGVRVTDTTNNNNNSTKTVAAATLNPENAPDETNGILVTAEEYDLMSNVQGVFEQYKQILETTHEIYQTLIAALSELSMLRSTTDTLIAPAIYALPVVPKQIQVGPRGGVRYVNSRGNVVWLKKSQKQKCKNGALQGAAGSCPVLTETNNNT